MKNNLIDIIKKEDKFLSMAFIVLALNYVFLFMLETILPGFVIEVFNLNILLLVVLILWLILIFIGNRKLVFKRDKLFVFTSFLIIFLILISLFFSLYKTDYLMIISYIFLVLVSGKALFGLWQER